MEGKYVEQVETVLCETIILNQVKQGSATVDQVEQRVKSLGLPFEHVSVGECIDNLVETEHLTKEGNDLRLTPDGQQDIVKVLPWFSKVTQGIGTVTPGAGRPR